MARLRGLARREVLTSRIAGQIADLIIVPSWPAGAEGKAIHSFGPSQ